MCTVSLGFTKANKENNSHEAIIAQFLTKRYVFLRVEYFQKYVLPPSPAAILC